MGCRLPTEAEWEYAARANTTTPFYTGNCISSGQANFNGNEPYANCEKSENRKKPLPVGSFPPNAFGLYDMHGNIWEWTNDWYCEYNVDNKLNPKGPETGTKKVIAAEAGMIRHGDADRLTVQEAIPRKTEAAVLVLEL